MFNLKTFGWTLVVADFLLAVWNLWQFGHTGGLVYLVCGILCAVFGFLTLDAIDSEED